MLSALTSRSREPSMVVAMLICGALARFAVEVRANTLFPYHTESYYIAVSLATTGRFADPFGYPSGPTAHVGMLTPLPSALVYWLFGGDSPYAESILCGWAGVVTASAAW